MVSPGRRTPTADDSARRPRAGLEGPGWRLEIYVRAQGPATREGAEPSVIRRVAVAPPSGGRWPGAIRPRSYAILCVKIPAAAPEENQGVGQAAGGVWPSR